MRVLSWALLVLHMVSPPRANKCQRCHSGRRPQKRSIRERENKTRQEIVAAAARQKTARGDRPTLALPFLSCPTTTTIHSPIARTLKPLHFPLFCNTFFACQKQCTRIDEKWENFDSPDDKSSFPLFFPFAPQGRGRDPYSWLTQSTTSFSPRPMGDPPSFSPQFHHIFNAEKRH